jgi:hypothetical protein
MAQRRESPPLKTIRFRDIFSGPFTDQPVPGVSELPRVALIT